MLVKAHWCVELGPQVSNCSVLGFLGLVLAHWCMEPGSGPSVGQGHVLWWWLWPQQVLRQLACWAELGPNINKLEENSKMAVPSTSVLVVEWPAKSHQRICYKGELHLLPASPGGSPRSIGGCHQGSFRTTASALGLGTCEILYVPF